MVISMILVLPSFRSYPSSSERRDSFKKNSSSGSHWITNQIRFILCWPIRRQYLPDYHQQLWFQSPSQFPWVQMWELHWQPVNQSEISSIRYQPIRSQYLPGNLLPPQHCHQWFPLEPWQCCSAYHGDTPTPWMFRCSPWQQQKLGYEKCVVIVS